MADDRYDDGMRVRREVLGDAHVDRAVAATTEFTAGFQDFITRYAWGDVWAREGLDRRTRSAITLAVLTALHCHEEVAMHVRAARRNGLTPDEIAEVLLHTSLYAGLPAANAAFKIAQSTLDEPVPPASPVTPASPASPVAPVAQSPLDEP
jgi:4-carboxymuconolactone decarboxylase